MRVLGVDMGERRIGLAISDESRLIASPLEVLSVKPHEDPLGVLVKKAEELGVTQVVVGMPLSLRGEAGPAAERMGRIIEALRERTDVPVAICDERLTSVVAARSMQEAGLTERDRRGRVDSVAAALILQTWLDRRRGEGDGR